MPTTEERLAAVEEIVGAARYMSPRLGLSEWVVAKNAVPSLPSGDRNVADRMRELGVSQDSIVEQEIPAMVARLGQMQATIDAQAAKIVVLEARPIGGGGAATSPVLPLVPANGTAVREMRNTNSVIYNEGDFEIQDAEVHTRPQSFMGQVAIGGKPVSNGPMLQLRQGGEILYLEKALEQKTQEGRNNPGSGDRWRCMVVSMNKYDNGFRLIRGGYYDGNGLLHRVEPVMHILGMDSSGWLSKSREDYSKPQVEKCQEYIIKEDDVTKEYVLVVCRAGWGARIAASTRTTNMNNPNNFDRSAQIIEPLPGAV